MSIDIINSSPRANKKGNTDKIVQAFIEGLQEIGETVKLHTISNKNHWDSLINTLTQSNHLIFAFPLYAESMPGILLEFFDYMYTKSHLFLNSTTNISFILHSGFPEACQRHCCEQYLKKIPNMLNCSFSGILSHGDSFGISIWESNAVLETLNSYKNLAQNYVKNDYTFFFKEAIEFNGQEYFSDEEAKTYSRIVKFYLKHLIESL